MNTSALVFSYPRRQRGAASLVIVVLLVFILAAAVMAALRMSGSSVVDSSINEAQVSALSLAESGLERAQATLTLAGYTSASCTSLTGTTSSLGRGTFTYAAVFNAGICTVTVTGAIGTSAIDTSSRTIRAALSNSPAQGVAGNGSTIPLRLSTGAANVAVITNLAYPAGATASIGSCTNPDACADILQVTGTGTSKLSNRSVFESVAASSVYAITQTLVSGGSPAPRNFVQVAAVFSPASGSVGHIGAYANSGTGGLGGSVGANWNCAPNSGTSTASNAAGANTLVYGFSSLAATGSQLNVVTLGGRSLTKIRDMTGKQGDNLYSQIWYINNPAYLSGTGTTSGAVVTGYAGKGRNAKPSGDKLCISFESEHDSGEEFKNGDEVSGSNIDSGTTLSEEPSVSGQAECECNGGIWDTTMGGSCKNKSMSIYGKGCRLNKSQSSTSSATVMVPTKLLTVTAAPKAYLEAGDTIYVGGVAKGKIVTQLTGTTGGVGTYSLDSNQFFSSATITSDGTTIITSGAAIPTVGQFVDVSSGTGTGQFQADTTVAASPAPTAIKYKVSQRPTTPLSGAQVCGGVCAFLDKDGTTTAFALTNISSGTDWSSGFTCLSNVNPAAFGAGEVIDSKRSQWSEVVK